MPNSFLQSSLESWVLCNQKAKKHAKLGDLSITKDSMSLKTRGEKSNFYMLYIAWFNMITYLEINNYSFDCKIIFLWAYHRSKIPFGSYSLVAIA